MQQLESTPQVQRFLSTHDQIANVFFRRADHDTATKFRAARGQAFATWVHGHRYGDDRVIAPVDRHHSAIAPSGIPSTTI